MSELLKLDNISHAYDKDLIVEDVSFTLANSEIGCLLGHSGSGKTTILRTIAGFENILQGNIFLDGELVSSPKFMMPVDNRGVGVVFQDYALFPHLSVQDNIKLALHRVKKTEQDKTVDKMLDLVRLGDLRKSYPHELSGGQQQRVALARSLAPKPKLILLDEPFSNLDVELRESLSMEVRKILKECSISALLVTHNQSEAFAMADSIGIVNDGSIEQWDIAHNIYHRPTSRFVANFVGEGKMIKGIVRDHCRVETALGILSSNKSLGKKKDTEVELLIRPEDILHCDESSYKVRIVNKIFRGANILYWLQLSSGELVYSLVPSHHQHEIGSEIGIIPQVEDLVIFKTN